MSSWRSSVCIYRWRQCCNDQVMCVPYSQVVHLALYTSSTHTCWYRAGVQTCQASTRWVYGWTKSHPHSQQPPAGRHRKTTQHVIGGAQTPLPLLQQFSRALSCTGATRAPLLQPLPMIKAMQKPTASRQQVQPQPRESGQHAL